MPTCLRLWLFGCNKIRISFLQFQIVVSLETKNKKTNLNRYFGFKIFKSIMFALYATIKWPIVLIKIKLVTMTYYHMTSRLGVK